MIDAPTQFVTLSPEEMASVNDACDRFEQAWQAGDTPNHINFMQEVSGPARFVLQKELAVIEIACRQLRGLSIDIAMLKARYSGCDPEWLVVEVQKCVAGSRKKFAMPDAIQESYEILNEAGRGGMGVVYQAIDRRLGRLVCLKSLTPETIDTPSRLDRIRREAQVIGSLNHPNICTIYGLDIFDQIPVLILEWIEGKTLRALSREGIRTTDMRGVLLQSARALAAAHQAGIVHRDVKPENIMVRSDGLVKVLDFGVARSLQIEGTATDNNGEFLVGTLKYMSPEQAAGRSVDTASDVFSLGVVFYEILTGQHPFPVGSVGAILYAIETMYPPEPRSIAPEIPEALNSLILRMLSKDPTYRPSMIEVEVTLRETSSDSPVFDWQPAPRTVEVPSDPVVGRSAELSILNHALDQVIQRRGSFVCITGEPGIGKTTLMVEFLGILTQRQSAHILSGRCSQRLASVDSYLPILDALHNLLEDRSDNSGLELLRTVAPTWYLLISSFDDQEIVGKHFVSQGRLLREFRAFLSEWAKVKPVVVFIDDIHWSDESTIDLLAYLAGSIETLPVLVIASFRPTELALEEQAFGRLRLDLLSSGKCTELELSLLTQDSIAKLIEAKYGSPDGVHELTEVLFRQTEGNPLFVHGLLKYMENQGVLVKENGGWTIQGDLTLLGSDLPNALTSLIERKLGYLPAEELRLLQIAAVQGVEFDSCIVAEISGLETASTEECLQRLEHTHGLVRSRRERDLPDGTLSVHYEFVHILYQNSLFAGLPPTRRMEWSRQIATRLEAAYQSKAKEVSSELAFLFETAREYPAASRWSLRAAQRDAVNGACREAAERCRNGLRLLTKIKRLESRDQLELELQYSLGFAESFTKGYSSTTVRDAYARAEELCNRFQDSSSIFPILHGLWLNALFAMDATRLDAMTDRMLHSPILATDSTYHLMAYGSAATKCLHFGDIKQASKYFQVVWDHEDADLAHDRCLLSQLCVPIVTLSQGLGAWCLWLGGQFSKAVEYGKLAIQRAESLGAPQFRAQAYHFNSLLHKLRGDAENALICANQVIDVAREYDLVLYLTLGEATKIWAELHLHPTSPTALDGVRRLEQAIEIMIDRGTILTVPHILGMIGESYLFMNYYTEAEQALKKGLHIARSFGERLLESELLLSLGELRYHWGAEGALDLVRESISVAHQQGAIFFELRGLVTQMKIDSSLRDQVFHRVQQLLPYCDSEYDCEIVESLHALVC